MQLNNNDEQTAAVRRELENRSERVKSQFYVKDTRQRFKMKLND